MLGRRRLGHRALLHRLRAARQRHHLGHVRGPAGLPGQGRVVGHLREVRRHALLHRADRDPGVHEVGRRVPGEARPLVAAAARDGRRADQPEGVALVPPRHRRRALPDRRHLVADRDRPHHDLAAAGHHRDQAGLGHAPAAGHRGAGRRGEERRRRRHRPGPADPAAPVAGMLRTLYGDHDRFIETYWDKFGRDVYFVGDAARKDDDGYYWVIGRVDDVLNVSGHRMSTAEIESAIVSHAEGRRGGRDRPAGRGHRPVGRGLRDARGRPRGLRRARRRHPRAPSPSGSASSRGPSASSGPTTCRRRARARSCAGCCATSPRAASWATSPRCATPTSCSSSKARSRSARKTRTSGAAVPAVAVGLELDRERRLEVLAAEQVDERRRRPRAAAAS